MFKLLRYFSLVSCIAFLVVTVLLGVLYRRIAVGDLITQEESKNVAVTQALANALRTRLLTFIAAADGLSGDELRAHPALDDLRTAINAEITGLPVAKIKIYDDTGLTLFSSEELQIGEENQANAGFQTALAGGVASELTHRDTFSSFDRVLEEQDVLSTYLPVRFGGSDGAITGVFEMYSNVTPLLRHINATQRAVFAGVSLILGLLYGVLFLIVRRADGIIRRQHSEQIEAEQRLQQQARALAVLRERERLARDLHDSVGQVLGYLSVQAQAIAMRFSQGHAEEAQRLLQRLVEVVHTSHLDVRKQIRALQAGASEGADVDAAPNTRAPEEPSDGAPPVGAAEREVEAQLLRIVQEALTNIRKHAHARHAWVLVNTDDRQAVVTIADDGKGFAVEQADLTDDLHFGLQMMRARAAEIGGTLEVESTPGAGTQITARVPLLNPTTAEENRA